MREGTPKPEDIAAGVQVVEFNAPWCGPCKAFAPKYEEIATDGRFADASFWAVDVSTDDGQALASEYTIRSVPTIVVFVEGVVREILVGADVSEAKLVSTLSNI